jgi:serine/threonine protein kinase
MGFLSDKNAYRWKQSRRYVQGMIAVRTEDNRTESLNQIVTQSGGILLGSGVYGCTFSPAPRCVGGKVFKKITGLPAVGKVTLEDAEDELAIGKELMALPHANSYFALPTTSCKPELPIRDKQAKRCEIAYTAKGSSMLIMPLAGIQLLSWGTNMQRLSQHYISLFTHLLEGILLYQRRGYVHNDIHMGNILVDSKNIARFIDFGLAFRPTDIRHEINTPLGNTFRPAYFFQAPEVHAWRMVRSGISIENGVRQLEEMNPELFRMELQFPSRPSLRASLSSLVMSSPFFQKEGDGVGLVKEYGTRFDSWRIGLCMWLFWDDLLHWPHLKKTEVWNQRARIRDALRGLTHFDVRARSSVEDALRILDPTNSFLRDPSSTIPSPRS